MAPDRLLVVDNDHSNDHHDQDEEEEEVVNHHHHHHSVTMTPDDDDDDCIVEKKDAEDDSNDQQQEQQEQRLMMMMKPIFISDDHRRSILLNNDDDAGYQEELIYPIEYKGHFDSLLLSSKEIRQRVKELAILINEDYGNKNGTSTTTNGTTTITTSTTSCRSRHSCSRWSRPVLICTLKGACIFFQHLCDELQNLKQGYDIEFIRASSYVGTNSTGTVCITNNDNDNNGDSSRRNGGGMLLNFNALKGRHVIVIEDILDTGTTLSKLVPYIHEHGQPVSVEVCTLLQKRHRTTTSNTNQTKSCIAKYVGFTIPNYFVIGYGLDYNEYYRDLRDIYIISKKGIETYIQKK